MKLISPCRYRVTFLWRCRAMALKPMRSNTPAIAAGSGAAYSMNSKPSVPIGLSQGLNFMRCILEPNFWQSASRKEPDMLRKAVFIAAAAACALGASVVQAQQKHEMKLAYFVGDQHAMSQWL